MTTKFTRNKLPQRTPPVCRKGMKFRVDAPFWTPLQLSLAITWTHGSIYGGWQTDSLLITCDRVPGTNWYRGETRTFGKTYVAAVTINESLRSVDIDLARHGTYGDVTPVAWTNIPAVRSGRLTTPELVTDAGPSNPRITATLAT